ncbi:hypothetical protein NECAME_16399 [Necator americanus]|uniref:Uncharacterized protein n=1 Tax=Necator americanus TaxID=51031 RepID=W2TZ89_NECAM|nr:hypothetical protein NECAME_16399 [Necator americanus]ETN86337.1 hypothetical protein NECAME_16399 [Necator americanus]
MKMFCDSGKRRLWNKFWKRMHFYTKPRGTGAKSKSSENYRKEFVWQAVAFNMQPPLVHYIASKEDRHHYHYIIITVSKFESVETNQDTQKLIILKEPTKVKAEQKEKEKRQRERLRSLELQRDKLHKAAW